VKFQSTDKMSGDVSRKPRRVNLETYDATNPMSPAVDLLEPDFNNASLPPAVVPPSSNLSSARKFLSKSTLEVNSMEKEKRKSSTSSQLRKVFTRDHKKTPSQGSYNTSIDNTDEELPFSDNDDADAGSLSDSMTTSDWNKAKEKSVKKVKKKNRISQIISVAYKSKAELFQKLFKDMTSDEQLILDYSCALHRDILVHGRLYLSQNWLCFYANIFGWETLVTIQWSEITAVTKEKTVKLIPNAIRISTNTEKYFFTTFVTRDNAYTGLFRIWQNALLGHPMNPTELKTICRNFRQKKHAKDLIDGDPVDDEHDETGDEVLEDDDGKSMSEYSDNLSSRLEPSLDTSATESMSNDHDSNNLPSPTNDRPPPTPVVNNNIPSIETSNASPVERKSSNDNANGTADLQKHVNDNPKNANENQKHSSENQKHANDNQKHANDNTKHANDNAKHANDNAKHANDNTKHANENQKHANENQKHSNGHNNNNKNVAEKSEHKNRNKHNKPFHEFLHFGKRKKVIRPKNKSYHLNIPDQEGDTTTDFDDETDEEEEENVLCPCHDSHTGKEYLSEEFNFDVDALYEHLFSQESDTMKRVFEVRNFINWRYTPLETQSNGDCIQSLSYTLPLNYSIGPSTSDTTSEQTVYKDNKPGLCHVVLAKNTSAGVPYSDSFNVTTKYCITRVGGNRSRLKVHGEVNYLKKVFGFVKNMISKSADEALKDYFDYLGSLLRSASELLPEKKKIVVSGKKARNKNRSAKDTASTGASTTKPVAPVTPTPLAKSPVKIEKESYLQTLQTSRTSLCIFIFLLLLLFSTNLYLYRRLNTLEGSLVVNTRRHNWLPDELPKNKEEWKNLLEYQQGLHELEILKLKQVIGSTGILVKQVETSIQTLYDELDKGYKKKEEHGEL